ncbi:MAG: VOC family protein, partial [Acidobacteriaceae bacterium]
MKETDQGKKVTGSPAETTILSAGESCFSMKQTAADMMRVYRHGSPPPGYQRMGFAIDHLDHLVLTVADIDATVAFYTSALGMELITFGERKALR